ncbi:MAG: hypothetical protein BIFFINMI_00744 [Phycisphaerae bacterium]|nr:hypothetical protein [Phycisphaerae bacterium]
MSADHTDAPLRVLCLTRKPDSPSFEHRVLRYLSLLADRGVRVDARTMPADRRGRRALRRELADFDLLWWHRYLIPPWRSGSWRRAARRILFDFDDPIHLGSRGASRTRRFKFRHWLRRCDAALAANDYLADAARPHCPVVHVVPMGVDAPGAPADRPAGRPFTLLWMGSQPTQRYLDELAPALSELGRRRPDATLRLVAHAPADPRFAPLRVDWRRWSPQEQAAALAECDVGLCPMPDTPWTRGKCPFKVLQYMAHGLPWVGSPVGENLRYAGPGDQPRGLLADDPAQWLAAIGRLADDAEAARAMGRRGRQYVLAHHDRAVLADRLADLFRAAAGVRTPFAPAR